MWIWTVQGGHASPDDCRIGSSSGSCTLQAHPRGDTSQPDLLGDTHRGGRSATALQTSCLSSGSQKRVDYSLGKPV
eukprot:868080-Rhodomonas_salina.1